MMAVYIRDDAEYFSKALTSVFHNSLKPSEVIVVADGPLSIALEEILLSFKLRAELNVIRLPKNAGLANALNVGLQAVSTKFVIRADSDDINHSNRFEKIMAVLCLGYDLAGSAILEKDKSGTVLAIRRVPLTQAEIVKFIKKRNPFNHMTVGYKTDTVRKAGGYPAIYLKEDYALWAVLIANGAKVCNLDDILVDATTGADMYRRRGGLKYAAAEIQMQKHLLRYKIKGPIAAAVDGLLRSLVFLAPSSIREFIYLKFLRKAAD